MRPFSTALTELLELQRRIDELFEQARAERLRLAMPQRLLPPADICAADDAYVIRLDLPGVPADAIHVIVEEGTIIVKGEKQPADDGQQTLRQERQFGDRSPVPSDVT